MTVTGFKVEGLGDNPAVHVCPDCADKLGLEADGRRVKEIATTQYRHGDGGGNCVFCGFDTLDGLSGRALSGDTPRSYVTTDERPTCLTAYADAIDASLDAFISIRLAPGIEPEETEIAPGVKKVDHPDDAPETLIVEFQRDNEDTPRTKACEDLLEMLEDTPLRAEIRQDNRGDSLSDAVHAVIDD